jgi:hypothetical protein
MFPINLKLLELGVVYPVNTVHRAGIDRLLDQLQGISILAVNPRSPVIRFNIKRVASHMGTVFAANAGNLINVNPPLAQCPS